MEASDRGFPRVVVLMPFGDEFNQIYDNLILPALDRCEVERAGNLAVQHNVLGYIIQSVADADLVVADLTGLYPFVLYELGIAHALAKPSVLLTQNVDELPFDLRPRMVVYSTYFADADHLRHTLRSTVTALIEGSLVEYSNPVMDFAPALFNGHATYPQTATLERLLNVVSARLEMARMAEVEAAEVVVKEAEVVDEEPVVVETPVEEIIDEVIIVEEPVVVEAPVEEVIDEVIVNEEAPVVEEMAVEAAEEPPVAEAVEETYVEVEEAVEEEAAAEAVEEAYAEGDIAEEAAEEEAVIEAVEEMYAEDEEAAEAVEGDIVEEAAEEEVVAEAVEATYGEVERVAEAVEGDMVEEAAEEGAVEAAYHDVEEAADESQGMPEKLLFTPFVPTDEAEEEPVVEEPPVEEADDAVETEMPVASGNGYGEAVEAEVETEAEAHGIAAAGLDAEEAVEEELPADSEADEEPVDDSASYEDAGDAGAEMGEEASVIELGAGETVVEADTAPESEGEEPESDDQGTNPWAY